ncbi:MAG TPA: formylglycine-generating enzyme family protein, partial [Chitinophagaceae bacterium]|nr:formylglycine-generating enzyme family protein [Chitinophagaceae bacterium]
MRYYVAIMGLLILLACNNAAKEETDITSTKDSMSVASRYGQHSCMSVPSRFGMDTTGSSITFNGDTSVDGMVLIPAGEFEMGGDNQQADPDELPKHKVKVSSFYMDVTEVTNAQFKKFADATGYITTAEKKPDWEEMKRTVPPGTPKPPDSVMVAASLVFRSSNGP